MAGSDEKFFQDYSPQSSDVFIAVMGVTGAGKSKFISHLTDSHVPLGHELEACTQGVSVYKSDLIRGKTVYLIDTPGFDDTYRTDAQILQEIAGFLTDSFCKNVRLNGLIYLHRITDVRLGGSAMKNLYMFKKLCGANALQNVILATTRWEQIDQALGEKREGQLRNTEEFWGYMESKGSKVRRHLDTRESALSLVREFIPLPTNKADPMRHSTTLAIQEEMVIDKKTLNKTQAGEELLNLFELKKRWMAEESKRINEQYQEALDEKDKEAAGMLQKQREEFDRWLANMEKQKADLRVDMEKLHEERMKKLEDKLAAQQEETRRLTEALKKAQEALEKTSISSASSASSDSSDNTAVRSNSPVPDNSDDYISVTLKGSYSFFCGPQGESFHYAVSHGIVREMQILKLGGISYKTRYVKFGGDDSEHYYHHYHVDGHCRTSYGSSINDNYPGISALFDAGGQASGCPESVELGREGYYFVRARPSNENFCNVPSHLSEYVEQFGGMDTVRRVWFGYGGCWVLTLEEEDGTERVCWRLGESDYPGLAEQLKDITADDIKDLTMNSAESASFILITTKGAAFNKPAIGWSLLARAGSFDIDLLKRWLRAHGIGQ